MTIDTIKDGLRKYTRRNKQFEKVWIILQWAITKYNARQYSDLEYTNKLWKKSCGRLPDFENPTTFNEKLWFLKLSNRDTLLTICSDKHAVREYIRKCGYEDILKKEYGVYKSATEIKFDELPSPCYIKCNHASGMNFIYRREDKNDIKHLKWKLNYFLRQNPYYLSREWNYKNIPPRIICEEVLSMPDGISDIPELQFFCFDGVPKFIMYNCGLADNKGYHKAALRWVYDMEWNIIPVKTSMESGDVVPEKPENYERMVEIAAKLSKPFPHVRVDLFNIEGKIFFNELTFYSGGGFVKLEPQRWQKIFGDYIDCSSYRIADDAKVKHKFS